MAVMRAVGNGHRLPTHAHVCEEANTYVITLDVTDFAESELSVEALGPRVTVKGDQLETIEDDGKAFRLHEQLRESFRLPDDAAADQVKVLYRHGNLEIQAPRTRLEPRRLPIRHRSSSINPDAEPC
jgi:HSP20 family molecular chaperone IbpA